MILFLLPGWVTFVLIRHVCQISQIVHQICSAVRWIKYKFWIYVQIWNEIQINDKLSNWWLYVWINFRLSQHIPTRLTRASQCFQKSRKTGKRPVSPDIWGLEFWFIHWFIPSPHCRLGGWFVVSAWSPGCKMGDSVRLTGWHFSLSASGQTASAGRSVGM